MQPDLKLDDTPPFRLSRNHLMIEKRDGSYHVRDLRSTLGTIVNGEPIGTHFRTDDAPLQAAENEVIAGGVDSPFVFSVYLVDQTGYGELCCRALCPLGQAQCLARRLSAHDHAPKRLRPFAACHPGAFAHISGSGMIVAASQRIEMRLAPRLHRQ